MSSSESGQPADPNPPAPTLRELLSALKAGAVYTMATPKDLAAAASLYSQGVVASFRWGESGQLLEVKMTEKIHPSVLFSSENGRLHTATQPPGGSSNRIVLAAIMTVVRVLNDSKFHQTDLSPIRLEKFRRQLGAVVAEKSRPRVVVNPPVANGPVTFDYDSGRREPSWRVEGPRPGMEWLTWQLREPERVGEAVCQWLRENAGTTDLEIRTRSDAMTVKNARVSTFQGRTEFSHRDGQVMVQRAICDAEGTSHHPFVDWGYGLVFLPQEKTVGLVQPLEAWKEFHHLGVTKDDVLKIPLSRFAVLSSETVNAWTLLDASGRPTAPSTITARGLIDVILTGEKMRACLRVTADPGGELPLHRPLAETIQELFRDGPFALLAKSLARRLKVVEGLFRMIRHPEDEEAEIQTTADDPTFTSRQMHGDDAVRCLHHLRDVLRSLDQKHLTAGVSADDIHWVVCTEAGRALGQALAVAIEIFPPADLLRSTDLSFDLEGRTFAERLPALTQSAQDHGVELRVDRRAPRYEKLDVSVRVVRGEAIDWFELHPEARAGAFRIPRSQWNAILASGFYQAEDGTLVTLDPAALDLLRQVAGLTDQDSLRLPRLRLFDWLALRNQGMACELPPELAQVLDSLQNLETLPVQPLPQGLQADLRAYQRHGYDWLSFLYRHHFGACLADDMGLGKTLQTITLLAALKEGILPGLKVPHLLVLPPTLLFNWQSEFEKFAPGLKIHEYTGQNRSTDFADADVVMTTYELVRRDIETLSALSFDVVIFDEAQAIKNSAAGRAQAVARLQARFRICLTGTPLENHLGEFHSIMETAVPGLFGDRREFFRDQEAGKPILARARPFLLRRTKEKILSELPPKVESDVYFSLSESQREFYTRAVGEVRQEILSAYEDRPAQQAGIMALAALLRLRQTCISPALLSKTLEPDSPKIEYLVEQLSELTAEGHAALVFSQFVKALDLVATALETAGLPFVRMDGSIPMPRRKTLVEDFQSGDSPGIFLISLKTGGAGLNLTRASYVYHLDPWWNPAVENQASDRVHRIGQKQSVFVQRLLMRHTVEEKMMTLKARKKALFDAVLDSDGITTPEGSAALSATDFQFLIES